ncbi:gamma-tubulin complex component 4, partial [Hyalella azteca]|uniref:Gamma-tubulin complex component n=1 Tax=Hyalella azteca TaxID=294128 RepID=A0A8B7P3H3_HYAAZ
MMQELLLALLGCDGPIFISSKSHYQIQNGVFSNWEEPLLSRVLELASHYSELLSFCNRCSQGKGRYETALAAAISDAVQPYKRAVVELERSVLKDESLSVTHVMTMLQPHAPLLSFLAGLVRDVEEGDVHGCKILEIVHQECRSAVHDTALMNRIEQSVHGVLYDQLTHWLLYGALLDPYKEFFLQPKDCEDSVVGLEPDLLPSHLPAALALAILFVGHAVRDFEAGRSKSSSA